MEKYYPVEWTDVSRFKLEDKYHHVMDTVNDGYDGRYALVRRHPDGRIFIRKRFNKSLIRSVRPRRWLREVRVLRELKHRNIQCYQESYLCPTYGEIDLEYCNYGGLDHFKAYMKTHELKIPEAFVWRVFDGLIRALAFMHYGIEEIEKMDDEDPYGVHDDDDWTPILHCDITIDCVLLKTYWHEQYPVAKLAKFGSGIHKKDSQFVQINSDWAGTDGWTPPEHPYKSEKVDVFQIGAVIQCLCNPDWREADPAAGVGDGYSKELNDLVKSAMEPVKRDRPDAEDMAREMLEIPRTLQEYVPVPLSAFERLIHQPY
jgi:serine/threonine protein kinase